jgi:toxin-antitoxin system PIN domain toxin
MIALDTNILIHLLVSSQREHSRAKAWFEKNQEALAITLTNLAELLRLLTHPRVFPHPLGLLEALELLQGFIEGFQVSVLEESGVWWLELKDLLTAIPNLRGNEIFDARIALCLRYNGIVNFATLDSDFSKYPFLKIVII